MFNESHKKIKSIMAQPRHMRVKSHARDIDETSPEYVVHLMFFTSTHYMSRTARDNLLGSRLETT